MFHDDITGEVIYLVLMWGYSQNSSPLTLQWSSELNDVPGQQSKTIGYW